MIRLRHAVPEDAREIHRLICALATYEREPDAVVVTVEILAQQIAAADPPFRCLLANYQGKTVGIALYFHNYSTWRGRPGVYLEDLFVDPEYRGKGIARRLMVQLAAICVDMGGARVDLSVLDWNQLARGFYLGLGMTPQTEWVGYRLEGEALERMAKEGESQGMIPLDGASQAMDSQ